MDQVVEFFNNNVILAMFLIAALGIGLGRIRIKGLGLGTAGVLIIALVFGHFGVTIPAVVQNLGLVTFVTSVGFIAGPTFFRNFKSNAIAYIVLGLVIVLSSVLTCLIIIWTTKLSTDLALGLLAGALTTTPGLAAGVEATGSELVSVGYGIAYPFGVLGVVLFVQLTPKVLKADLDKERAELAIKREESEETTAEKPKRFVFDKFGFFILAIAIVLGILLGKITIPLPGGAKFSLGTSGGPLIIGLIMGHFGHIGKLDISVKKETLSTMREFGLILFLMGAGTTAGHGFVDVLVQQGGWLFLYGAIMTLVPLFVGSFIALKCFKLNTLNTLGAICGGMTSTPALGCLIRVADTDDVASSYAATYPIALAAIVLSIQLIGTFM